MKRIALYSLLAFGVLILATFILIFRPVPIVTEDKAITETGIVSDIYSNKGNDVVFVMANKQRRFYINRGLENGLDLNNLKQQLIGQPVVVKYPNYWTPLDWHNSVRHISKLEFNGEILFNELKIL